MDYQAVKSVLEALELEQVRYAVIGGAALNLHGLARFTKDLDLVVEATAANIERVKSALRSVFADPSIEEILVEDLLGEYPAVQYVPPQGEFHLDILTRLGDMYRFQDLEIQRVPFDGLTVTVATPRTLYDMKRSTVRLQDRADAEALRRRFRLEED